MLGGRLSAGASLRRGGEGTATGWVSGADAPIGDVLALARLGGSTRPPRWVSTTSPGTSHSASSRPSRSTRRSLGFTELSAGNPAGATEHFLRALSISSEEVGIARPAILRLQGDAVAALVTLGRIGEARRLTDQLDASAQANHLPWATAIAGVCHGLLQAAEGRDTCRG